MGTFLFDDIIFGPVKSRRLGRSLGINLLPVNRKICNFDCIYCECGWSHDNKSEGNKLPSAHEVYDALKARLQSIANSDEEIDMITYAGNGEPTLHPEFDKIIEDCIALRDEYLPGVKIAVLSNAACLHVEKVKKSLKKIDLNILKLDSAFDETVQLINKPPKNFTVEKVVNRLLEFDNLILQTLFLEGEFEGKKVNNASETEISAWIEIVEKLNPQLVMIYTIQRDTPADNLFAVQKEKLMSIAQRVEALGIDTSVSA